MAELSGDEATEKKLQELLLATRNLEKLRLQDLTVEQVQDLWMRKCDGKPALPPAVEPAERPSLAELLERLAADPPSPGCESPGAARAKADAENRTLVGRGIDKDFLAYSFETLGGALPGKYRQAAALVARLLEPGAAEPRLLALSGPTGRGKTGIAAVLCRRAAQRGMSFFCTAPHLYLNAWDAARGSRRADLRKNHEIADLVVFDESQRRRIVDHRPYLEDEFLSLLDKRQANRRATLLITNLEPNVFLANVGEPMWRRMREKGGVISTDWGLIREPSFTMPASART